MSLQIDVITLFPRMLDGFLAESILAKGIAAGRLGVKVHDLRSWCMDKHRTADDRPFGGGAGMAMLSRSRFSRPSNSCRRQGVAEFI
jgi:tRNA (guanine37-N1)-methyltransferase